MTNEKKGMGKGLIIGIFTGATIGSIIALLYAPKSGKKFRKYIKTKSQDFIEDADKYISNAQKDASQLIKDVKKKSKLLVADAEEKVDALFDESENILSEAKNKVGDYVQKSKVKLEKESGHLKSALKAVVDDYKNE